MKRRTEKQPLVSVVIPVYNGENYIETCLKSVFRQSYKNIEVVVVDDGSTDGSLEIIRQFPQIHKIIQQKNGNVSNARNSGVRNSSGEFIAFLDQDDRWSMNKIQKQVEIFNHNRQIDLVFTDLIKFWSDGREHHAKDKHDIACSLTDRNLFETLLRKNVIMPSSVMVRRQSFIDAGWFDETFKTCGDYEMWLRMAAKGMRFYYLPECHLYYGQHGSNTSEQIEIMFHDRIKAVTKTFENPELDSEQRKLEKIGMASALMMGAHTFFSKKYYSRFYENARKAFSYSHHVVDQKFVTRYIRSWLYVNLKKKLTV